MLFRFPPTPADPRDPSFLSLDTTTYAKYKQVNRSGTRNVFLTEHTLVFTISGTKLLHLPGQVLNIGPNSVVLLKRGIYVMAEYLEKGLDFEALMLFLPVKTVREFIHQQKLALPKGKLIGKEYLREGGSFTLTSGIASEMPARNGTTVAMINGAINSFVLGAAQELKQDKRINAVSPGLVEDSLERYGALFPGYDPVPMSRVVNAYVRSIEGALNGEIIKVYQ